MRKGIAALVGFAGLAVIAMAPQASAQQARPCEPDIKKLCSNVSFGGGRVRDCLREHAKELSPGCKGMMDTNQGIFASGRPAQGQRRQAVLEVCKGDLEKHCKGLEPGGGRLRECLKKHESELSDACKKTLTAAAQHGQGAPQAQQGKVEQKPK